MKKLILLIGAFVSSTIVSAQAPRKVIIEDFTAIWCGYCPNARTSAEHCEKTFGSKVICIGVHSGDALSTGYPDKLVTGMNVAGFPTGAIDRFYDTAPNTGLFQGVGGVGYEWDATIKKRLNTTSPVAVSIKSTYNTVSRTLSATVTASFVANASGNMNLNCVLVEDSIQTDGKQRNYMDKDAGSPWMGKGDPITKYVQRDVARANLSSTIFGDAGIIPVTVTSGSSYSKTYTLTIPTGWNDAHMKIVGFVERWGSNPTTFDTLNSYIINAQMARLRQNTLSGVNEQTNSFKIGNSFPNPFNNLTAIPLQLNKNAHISVKVYNIFGVEVNTIIDENLIAGEHTFYWAGDQTDGAPVANGLYIYKITDNSQTVIHSSVILNR